MVGMKEKVAMVDSYWLYEDKLQDAYKESFCTVKAYVNASIIDDQTKGELLNTMLDMLLTAQEEGEPPEKVTGKDLERFCANYCSGYGVKEQIFYFGDKMIGGIHILLFMSALDMLIALSEYLEGNEINVFTYYAESSLFQYGIGLFLIGLAGVVFDFFTKKYLFQKFNRKIFLTVVKVIYIGVVIAFCVAMIYAFFKHINILPDIPAWITFFSMGLLTIFYHIATKEHRKEQKAYQVTFGAYFGGSEQDGISQLEKERYFKINCKREKKGEPSLTQEEFLIMEQAECEKLYKNPFQIKLKGIAVGVLIGLLAGIFVIFCHAEFAPSFGEMILQRFETPTDFVIFIILIVLLIGIVLYGCWRSSKRIAEEKLEWIRRELENHTVWEPYKKR